MAKVKQTASAWKPKPKKNNKGVHSKNNKPKKKSRGQGCYR